MMSTMVATTEQDNAEDRAAPPMNMLQLDTLRYQLLEPARSVETHAAKDRMPSWERHIYERFAMDSIPTQIQQQHVPTAFALSSCRKHIEEICKLHVESWMQQLLWQAILEECYEAWATTSNASFSFAAAPLYNRLLTGIGLCRHDRPSRGGDDTIPRTIAQGGRVAEWLQSQTESLLHPTNPYLSATPQAMTEFLYRKEGRPTQAQVVAQLQLLASTQSTQQFSLTPTDHAMLAQLFQYTAPQEPPEFRIAVHDRNTYTLRVVVMNNEESAEQAAWIQLRHTQLETASWTPPSTEHSTTNESWLTHATAELPGPVAQQVVVEDIIPAELIVPTTRRGRGRTIYYGTASESSGSSPKQLQEAVLRWITEQHGPATLSQCAEQLEVAASKIRTVLGKLVWQKRQVVEKIVELEATTEEESENGNDTDAVLKYARSVQATEEQLRRLILSCLTAAPPHKLALAGDESSSNTIEEDYTDAEWQETGHDFLQYTILRPILLQEESILQTYQITSFTPARKTPEGTVERRARFRAEPPEGPVVELTEAQVWAGRHAFLATQKQHTSHKTFVHSMRLHTGSAHVQAHVIGHDTTVQQQQRYLLLLQGANAASWATLDGTHCRLDDDDKDYHVRLVDYDHDSAAYQECVAILKYLQRQPKGKPFLFPVDPIALGIPNYRDVVKTPMDVSTVFSKLERGEYSNPPNVDNNPVISMLSGPFRDDIELIFDNAMLFNPPDDWIHLAALGLKKSVLHKIEQACRNVSSSQSAHRSIYVEDEFSDEDMPSSRKRKRRGGDSNSTHHNSSGSSRREDAAAAVIADSVRLESLKSRLAIVPQVSQFALDSTRWLCRCKSQSALDELKTMYQQRTEQRSRRAARKTADSSTPTTKTDLEFYTQDATLTATNRLQVEMKQEGYHERMARLYQQARNTSDAATTTYYPACLPPYLGRVLDGKWEIRQDCVFPALRWVLRGLAQTEHVVLEEEWVTPNSLYYADPIHFPAFDVLERKAAKKSEQQQESDSDDDVELSAYEKARKERVARNNEKLRLLGLT